MDKFSKQIDFTHRRHNEIVTKIVKLQKISDRLKEELVELYWKRENGGSSADLMYNNSSPEQLQVSAGRIIAKEEPASVPSQSDRTCASKTSSDDMPPVPEDLEWMLELTSKPTPTKDLNLKEEDPTKFLLPKSNLFGNQ